MITAKTVLLGIAGIFVGLLIADTIHAYLSAQRADTLSEQTFTDPIITSPNASFSVLFAGDSIAAGVGAPNQSHSVMGRTAKRLAQNYSLSVENTAVSGTTITSLNEGQLRNITENYDLAVVIITSNDLLRFTSYATLRKEANLTVNKLSKIANHTILIGPGRVHGVSGIPFYLKASYYLRGKEYSRILKEISAPYPQIRYISPYDDLDLPEYGPTEAKDNFHPNAEGHKYWSDMVLLGLQEKGIIQTGLSS